MDKIVTFRSYYDLTKAELAKAKLDDCNIPCFLTDVHINGLYAGAFVVKLNIFEKDYQRAFETLIEDFELDKDAIGDAVKCPKCHSYHISKKSQESLNHQGTMQWLKQIFLGLNRDTKFTCQDCSTSFNPNNE